MLQADETSLMSDELDILYLLSNKYLNFIAIFTVLNTIRPYPPISRVEILFYLVRLQRSGLIKIKKTAPLFLKPILFSVTFRGAELILEREEFMLKLATLSSE